MRENPGLVFEVLDRGIDRLVVDLMVAVSCSKTWYAETAGAKHTKLTMAESEFLSILSVFRAANRLIAAHLITLPYLLGSASRRVDG